MVAQTCTPVLERRPEDHNSRLVKAIKQKAQDVSSEVECEALTADPSTSKQNN